MGCGEFGSVGFAYGGASVEEDGFLGLGGGSLFGSWDEGGKMGWKGWDGIRKEGRVDVVYVCVFYVE